MRRQTIIFALLVALLVAQTVSGAERYEIDTAHTFVTFSIDHLVVSKARGSFKDVSGVIMYDAKDISKSSVEVNIKTESINTNNDNRDKHLRSADFFDVEKYPLMTFKSKRVEKRGDGFAAVGDLTIHGVTKEVTMPFKLNGPIKDPSGTSRVGIEASMKIDRRDFGITWGKTLDSGGLMLGNDVTIEINVEAIIPKPKTN